MSKRLRKFHIRMVPGFLRKKIDFEWIKVYNKILEKELSAYVLFAGRMIVDSDGAGRKEERYGTFIFCTAWTDDLECGK